jgi:hypothetical protein
MMHIERERLCFAARPEDQQTFGHVEGQLAISSSR